MVMNSNVGEATVSACADVVRYELWNELAIPAVSFDVVDSVPRGYNVPDEKPASPACAGDATSKNGAMLVAITGEQVVAKHRPLFPGHHDRPLVIHCCSNHRITLRTLVAAVSTVGSRRVLRRES